MLKSFKTSGVVGEGHQHRHFFPGFLPDFSIEDIDIEYFLRDSEDPIKIISDNSSLRGTKIVCLQKKSLKGRESKAMKLAADQKNKRHIALDFLVHFWFVEDRWFQCINISMKAK